MSEKRFDFPTWLEMTMRTRSLTQAELARTMGVGETQISRWRRGLAVPTVHSLQRLAETLGVSRLTLDQLAGYPTGGPGDVVVVDKGDDETNAELQAHLAILANLMERRVPRELWHVYVEGCSALADALGRSFNGTLERAGIEPRSGDVGRATRPTGRLGFHEPSHRDSEQSGEQHGSSDRR